MMINNTSTYIYIYIYRERERERCSWYQVVWARGSHYLALSVMMHDSLQIISTLRSVLVSVLSHDVPWNVYCIMYIYIYI